MDAVVDRGRFCQIFGQASLAESDGCGSVFAPRDHERGYGCNRREHGDGNELFRNQPRLNELRQIPR